MGRVCVRRRLPDPLPHVLGRCWPDAAASVTTHDWTVPRPRPSPRAPPLAFSAGAWDPPGPTRLPTTPSPEVPGTSTLWAKL